MNGICTYTVEAHTDTDTREVPCGKPRVGLVTGPGIRVVVCQRHFTKVSRAIVNDPRPIALVLDVDVEP